MKIKISKFGLIVISFLVFGILLFPVCKEGSTDKSGDVEVTKKLSASLAFLPKILESPEKGVFVDLVRAIDTVYDGDIEIKVHPFPVSLDNIIKGKADFHMPMIRSKLGSEESLPYRYASETMGYVYFVIYSNKGKALTVEKINKAKTAGKFPYKIETIKGFKDYYDFPIIEGPDVAEGLKKTNDGKIDAFIFAQEEGDYTLKQLKLNNIHRELYDKFDDVIVIPKGERGKEIDKIISACIKTLKASNTWQKLHYKVHVPYQKWQP